MAGRRARRKGETGARRRAPARAKLKPEPLDRDLARRLFERGLSVLQIARRTGYSYKTVHFALREVGVSTRRPALTRAGRHTWQLYQRWKGMRGKCRNPNNPSYPRIGGRGIRVCAEWEDFQAFRAWALASGFRPGLDLGRIRLDRDYSPKNCVWRTRAQSALLGKRAASPPIRAFGETKPLGEWAQDRRCVVSQLLLKRRLQVGHEPEVAMTTPSGGLRGAPTRKRARPVLPMKRAPGRRARSIDWKQVVREWRANPTTAAGLARRLGVGREAVEARMGDLLRKARRRIVAPDVRTRLRRIWNNMQGKVNDPSDNLYRWFGAKGIGICREWQRFEPFLEWAARSGYRPGLCLGRRDRSKGFSPGNCVWRDRAETNRQPKRGVRPPPPLRLVEAFGETKGIPAWALDRRCAVSRSTLLRRLDAGWEPEAAITAPPQHRGNPGTTRVRAFGEVKTVCAWARDRRCRVGEAGLRQRLARGIPAEIAITSPGFQLDPVLAARFPERRRASAFVAPRTEASRPRTGARARRKGSRSRSWTGRARGRGRRRGA